MATFALGTLVAWTFVVVVARVVRGMFFAAFAGVMLGIHGLSSVGFARLEHPLIPVFGVLQCVTFLHFLALASPQMRPLAFRVLVNWPASWFIAVSFLAVPWSVAGLAGIMLPWPWIPFVLATVGLIQSLLTREEVVSVALAPSGTPSDALVRLRPSAPASALGRPLRIIQLTDTHLGPFMSVQALARIAERAVERDPDLILLTGDYLTMESQGDAAHLRAALAPLAKARGRVFACHGNHDLEAPAIVAEALRDNGIRLLLDEEAVVETPCGAVQILGAEYRSRDRRERLESLAKAFPRREGTMRIWLLHHPGAFAEIPNGEADLVLSGHTHGGQLGLVSLGLPYTAVSLATKIPDHGLFGRGSNRLYVHRGTCHYGFPLRIGVPAERSMMHVHRIAPAV